MKLTKKQTFMEGASILAVAHILVKLIGALFKIPLAGILQETGMAYFSRAYNLYAALFVVATAGLPVAVSKMVSASIKKENYADAQKTLKVAILLLSVIGLFGTLVLFLGARFFADTLFNSPGSYLSILVIAPAVFFISVLSAFRGYFQGHKNMTPTGCSELIEALSKLVVGLVAAYFLVSVSYEVASAGAISGVTLGGFLALLFLVFVYLKNRKNTLTTNNDAPLSGKKIFFDLLTFAIPIAIGSAVMSLTNVIDTFMISFRLTSITVDENLFKTLTEFFGVANEKVSIGNKMTTEAADVLYGSYSGYAMSLFNLPPSIVTSISMAIVPAISSAIAGKQQSEAKSLTESSIRITTIFALPCAIGMSVLASPILIALYNNNRAQDTLALLSLAVVFVCIVSVSSAILQGAGHVYTPVRNMIIGGVFKVISNYTLIGLPQFNIGGAPISTFFCYLIIASLNIFEIHRKVGARFDVKSFVLKPVVSTVIMGIAAFGVYNLLANMLGCPVTSLSVDFMPEAVPVTPVLAGVRIKTIIALGIAIFAGVLAYAASMLALRAFNRYDIEQLPKGKRIASLMDKFKLL